MATWQLIDIGRTMVGKIPGMYEFVQNYAHKFFPKERADLLADRASKREINPELITQDVFSDFCTMWVAANKSGDFKVNAREHVYPDTVPFVVEQKKQKKKIGVLTSGDYEFTNLLLDVPLEKAVQLSDRKYKNLNELVDKQFRGEEWGDKNDYRTFSHIQGFMLAYKDSIEAVFDDKVPVVEAALKASCEFPNIPRKPPLYKVVWMNRKKIQNPEIQRIMWAIEDVAEFHAFLFLETVTSFDDYSNYKFRDK